MLPGVSRCGRTNVRIGLNLNSNDLAAAWAMDRAVEVLQLVQNRVEGGQR